MSTESSDPLFEALVAEASRGFELRDAGLSAEALDAWDQMLAGGEQSREDVKLVMARVMHAKTHLLLKLGRAVEAQSAAADAAAFAGSMMGTEGEVIAAQTMGLQRSALTELGRLDAALAIDQRLSERYGDSETFALRLCAARALQHELWGHMNRKEQARAIACAHQVVDVLRSDEDPQHLIEIGELILSSAETLNHHPIWRGAAAPLRDQARAMCDAVLDMAERIGGDIGAAVAVNARLAASNANARDRRFVTFFTESRDRPSIQESALTALEQVQEAAQASGAETRYRDLVLERAVALNEVGRTDEALQLIDDLIARLDAQRAKGGVVLARAMRRIIAS